MVIGEREPMFLQGVSLSAVEDQSKSLTADRLHSLRCIDDVGEFQGFHSADGNISGDNYQQDIYDMYGNDSYYFGPYGDVSMFSADIRVFLITLYALTTVLAFGGNLLVVITLATGTRLWKLRCFLINLAVSDLLIAVFCLPFTFTKAVLGKWHFGGFMCPFVTFMQYLAVSVSVFTNVAIGFDRYWAVVRPMEARITAGRARIVIAGTWVFGFALAAPQLAISRQSYNNLIGHECFEHWTGDSAEIKRYIYITAVLVLSYVVPCVILAFTYGTVGQRLWERTTPGEAYSVRDQRQRESKKKVIKMLVVIVIAFGVCWLPLHSFSACHEIWPEISQNLTAREEYIFYGAYIACHWCAMAHSFVNPIIYGFLQEKFRKDVRILLRCCFRGCCGHSPYIGASRSQHGDMGSPYTNGRISRKGRNSSTDSNRSRTATFSLGCGLRRQDTVEVSLGPLPLPQLANKHPPINREETTSSRLAVSSV